MALLATTSVVAFGSHDGAGWEGHGLQPCRPNRPVLIGTSGTRALPACASTIFTGNLEPSVL